jgi:hypothetical protein
MNSKINEVQGPGATVAEKPRNLKKQILRLAAILVLSTPTFAQYGGGGTVGGMGTPTSSGTYSPSGRSYGHGAAIGAGVGAAAIGVGVIYLMTHRASKISGCVGASDDGLNLTDDRTKKTVMLVPGNTDVKAGDRVELKGKFTKNATGDQRFLVKTVAKDFGECHTQAAAGNASTLALQVK